MGQQGLGGSYSPSPVSPTALPADTSGAGLPSYVTNWLGGSTPTAAAATPAVATAAPQQSVAQAAMTPQSTLMHLPEEKWNPLPAPPKAKDAGAVGTRNQVGPVRMVGNITTTFPPNHPQAPDYNGQNPGDWAPYGPSGYVPPGQKAQWSKRRA
jgi:hypothetical protein